MGPYPFVKWAGGKGQLLDQFEELYPPPRRVGGYLEPFVGSGAVFFDVQRRLAPDPIVLSDDNEELINVYRAVQTDVDALLDGLREHHAKHSKRHFYAVRGEVPADATLRAARFIYLNRTCFNGLYRVNSRGLFNVPMGRYKNPLIVDEENLRAVSAALVGVRLEVAPFQRVLDWAKRGDFVYFDPPYHPLSATSSFTSYTKGLFGEQDQSRLAKVYTDLSRRGCFVMLSNSDTPLVRALYGDFRIESVLARRSINSRADRRGAIRELVVLNYDPSGRRLAPRHRPRKRRAAAANANVS